MERGVQLSCRVFLFVVKWGPSCKVSPSVQRFLYDLASSFFDCRPSILPPSLLFLPSAHSPPPFPSHLLLPPFPFSYISLPISHQQQPINRYRPLVKQVLHYSLQDNRYTQHPSKVHSPPPTFLQKKHQTAMVASRKEPNAGAAPLLPPPLSSNSPPTAASRPMVARPYSQLQLTIEPDCFILQPHKLTCADTGPTGTPHASVDILRISFRTTDSNTKEAPTEPAAEKATVAEVKEQAEKEPIGLSAIAEEHPQRVSLISPRTTLSLFAFEQ